LLLLAVALSSNRPDTSLLSLQSEVRLALPALNAKPAERLKEPLGEKLTKLRKVQEDRSFPKPPVELRDQLVAYQAAIEAYQALKEAFRVKLKGRPENVASDRALAELERALADFSLPLPYAAAWRDTEVGARLDQWRDDVKLLRKSAAVAGGAISERKLIA